MTTALTHDAYIGIGANLGDAKATVLASFAAINQASNITLVGTSSLYRTEPIDAGGEDYINAVAHIQTTLSAQDLLNALQNIEQEFGRERPYYHAPRTLDLDVLLYDDITLVTPTLTLPHPAITERAFVLVPLTEIVPTLIIPHKGLAADYLAQVKAQRIERIPH